MQIRALTSFFFQNLRTIKFNLTILRLIKKNKERHTCLFMTHPES